MYELYDFSYSPKFKNKTIFRIVFRGIGSATSFLRVMIQHVTGGMQSNIPPFAMLVNQIAEWI